MTVDVSLRFRLSSERLDLRPPRTSDVPELQRLLRVNGAHLRPWSPAHRPDEDPNALTVVAKTILRQRREWRSGAAYTLLMAAREADAPIVGRIALSGVARGVFQSAYLGYWIDAAHQGRGLTTEAVRAVVDFAFGTLGLHRVQAAVMPRNAASHRVLAKLAFRREGRAERYLQIAGRWEDHDILAVTTEEWKS